MCLNYPDRFLEVVFVLLLWILVSESFRGYEFGRKVVAMMAVVKKKKKILPSSVT